MASQSIRYSACDSPAQAPDKHQDGLSDFELEELQKSRYTLTITSKRCKSDLNISEHQVICLHTKVFLMQAVRLVNLSSGAKKSLRWDNQEQESLLLNQIFSNRAKPPTNL
jgi:hypothetical protein